MRTSLISFPLMRTNRNKTRLISAERSPFWAGVPRMFATGIAICCCAGIGAQENSRIQDLERRLAEQTRKVDALVEQIGEPGMGGMGGDAWYDRFTLGGYGETHANFREGSESGDMLDNHRFVIYAGYAFSDWVTFHSETEIEHSFVDDGNGYLNIEQMFTDFSMSSSLNFRAGRYLVPVGIINATHEPTTFNGVERPSMAKYIIPSTWSADGIGAWGNWGESMSYQFYVGSGLDGSGFDATNGLRKGRMKERPGINDPGVTGRIDMNPLSDEDLRVGLSFFAGGLDNSNKGEVNGTPGDVLLVAADFEYSWSRFDLRGVYATASIDDADKLNAIFAAAPFDGREVAERITGYYLEAAAHIMPDGWKTERLADADLVAFVRYEDYDTQDKMPVGATANPAGDRQELTFGFSFFPAANFVIKADYQVRDGVDDLMNVGVGFTF